MRSVRCGEVSYIAQSAQYNTGGGKGERKKCQETFDFSLWRMETDYLDTLRLLRRK